MLREFKAFLIKENVLSLALAVVIGAALGKVVQAIVDDFIMPVVGAMTPGGAWRTATLDIGSIKFGLGDFVSVLINFIMIGFVVWRISKAFIRPAPSAEAPPTMPCRFCKMAIDTTASRCPHCTSQLA
ncbi:MAG: MscL family protein [Gemmatimonadaceae bacterium]|nr:MscL family protein [Gemmatimonadaceae bacterium]